MEPLTGGNVAPTCGGRLRATRPARQQARERAARGLRLAVDVGERRPPVASAASRRAGSSPGPARTSGRPAPARRQATAAATMPAAATNCSAGPSADWTRSWRRVRCRMRSTCARKRADSWPSRVKVLIAGSMLRFSSAIAMAVACSSCSSAASGRRRRPTIFATGRTTEWPPSPAAPASAAGGTSGASDPATVTSSGTTATAVPLRKSLTTYTSRVSSASVSPWRRCWKNDSGSACRWSYSRTLRSDTMRSAAPPSRYVLANLSSACTANSASMTARIVAMPVAPVDSPGSSAPASRPPSQGTARAAALSTSISTAHSARRAR